MIISKVNLKKLLERKARLQRSCSPPRRATGAIS